MRLLWLIDSLNVGGAESLVIPFATRVQDITVAYLHAAGENVVEQELRRRGVRTVNLEARNLRDRRAFRRLVHLVTEEKFDLVHAHLTYSAIWAARMSRATGVPSVVSLHASPAATKSLNASFVNALKVELKDRLMRFVVGRWSRRVIMVSAWLRDLYSFRPDQVRVVHNGIEVSRFQRDRAETRTRLEREFNIPPGVKIAVTVSVLRPGKGIEVLLDAVEGVPDTYFLIVGDGPKRAEWQALTLSKPISDRVRWAGYRTDVDAILAGCDVFVHPSLDDAFPTVLLEAMAAGLPVVASRVGGIPEIVVENVGRASARPTGVLVPPGDASALANAIMHVDPTMGIAARERAQREFSIDAWIARLNTVYAEVLKP